MKKIGNIRKKFLTRERLMLITERLVRSSKQNGWTDSQRQRWMDFFENYEENINRIYYQLRYQVWEAGEFIMFKRQEGKKMRTIYESKPEDLIVDTLLTDCLMYVFWEQKQIIPQSCYGSIKGKGQHELREQVIRSVHGRKNVMVFIGDTSKYYPTMVHNVLKQILRLHIKDSWLLWLCDVMIDRLPEDKGLALGVPSSNPIGHIYHAELDWYMLIIMQISGYKRFCDDKVMIHTDSNYLHTAARVLLDKTKDILGQTLKSNWRIVNCTEERFEFLGAMINSHGARMKSDNRRRAERRIKRIIKKGNAIAAFRSWSGIKGGMKSLAVGNLINYWKEIYPEFFELLHEARRVIDEEKHRNMWHRKMKRILETAVDYRSEINKIVYQDGFANAA